MDECRKGPAELGAGREFNAEAQRTQRVAEKGLKGCPAHHPDVGGTPTTTLSPASGARLPSPLRALCVLCASAVGPSATPADRAGHAVQREFNAEAQRTQRVAEKGLKGCPAHHPERRGAHPPQPLSPASGGRLPSPLRALCALCASAVGPSATPADRAGHAVQREFNAEAQRTQRVAEKGLEGCPAHHPERRGAHPPQPLSPASGARLPSPSVLSAPSAPLR